MSKPREIRLATELYSDENFRTRGQLQWGNLFVTWIFDKINSSGNGLIWVPRQAIRCVEERQLTMIRYRTILRHSLSNSKFRQFFVWKLFFCWQNNGQLVRNCRLLEYRKKIHAIWTQHLRIVDRHVFPCLFYKISIKNILIGYEITDLIRRSE